MPPKSAFSCEACRRRKVKCDTKQPKCARCVARGETCVYVLAPSLSYTKTLEQRIATLEDQLAQARGSPRTTSDAQVLRSPGSHSTPGTNQPRDENAAAANFPNLERDVSGRISFHGSTSFLSLGGAGASTRPESTNSGDDASSIGKQELVNNAWTQRAFEKFSTLPEAIQFLLDAHWCWVQPLFNFVYRPAFTRDLKDNGPYCSAFLLNTVLSHSVRWAKADSNLIQLLEPFEQGAYFGRQARASIMSEVQSGPPSIPTVQALLLLSAEDCGKGNLTQAWLYSGMAFRLIVDLGIVFDGRKFAGAVRFSTEEIEIRNRLFWSCYFWDKLISLYLGRLPALQETSVSPPRDILDDTGEIDSWMPHGLSGAGVANYPPMQAHTTSCFISTCALSRILNTILVTMYNPVQQASQVEVVQCAFEEDQRLAEWHEQLPDHLKMVPSATITCPPSHIVTLNCLYHTTQILLHRPMLTTYGKQSSLDDQENGHHLRKCLESAMAILFIFNLLTTTFGYGHVVLSQAYTVYTASSIFLLQVQATKDTTSQAMENLKLCVEGLERIKATSPVLNSALSQIYKALSTLDPNLVVAEADGTHRLRDATHGSGQTHGSIAVPGDAAFDHFDFNFGDTDFSDLGMPADFFSILPELEPIAANVNQADGFLLNEPFG